MSDVLDIDEAAGDCLAVRQEVEWTPRKPTSYIINVFTIESKILPELKYLRDGILDGKISNTDKLLNASKSTDDIAAIWADRLNMAIKDWSNTINWTSPDFNPAWTTTENEKTAANTAAETRFSAIGDSLTSNTGVFGAAFKTKIDDAYGAYTQT
jgi:hypothetical protein